jgi:hypothetical protein
MFAPLLGVVLASCATAPPSGQTCDDTMALAAPTPLWLPLAIIGALIVITVVVTLVRTRANRS